MDIDRAKLIYRNGFSIPNAEQAGFGIQPETLSLSHSVLFSIARTEIRMPRLPACTTEVLCYSKKQLYCPALS